MAEITIAEDLTGGGVGATDPFSEFGEFGDEFGGGMEDIERARKAVTFEEDKDRTDRDSLQVYYSPQPVDGLEGEGVVYNNTVEPPIKDTPNKGHLSIKDTSHANTLAYYFTSK